MKNIFISALFILFATYLIAQDTETIVYDLNKGEFLGGQFSYLKNMTIKGAAILGNDKVDAIQLIITKDLAKEKEKFDVNELKIEKLNEEILALSSTSKKLIDVKSETDDAEKIADTLSMYLSKLGYSGLVEHDKVSETVKNLNQEIEKINSEIGKKSKAKIKLQSENIDIEVKLGNAKFAEELWIRKGDETEFSFTLQNTLEMTTNYSFDFKIFKQNNSPFPVANLLDNLMSKVDSLFSSGQHSIYPESLMKNDIQVTVNKINNELFSEVYVINKSQSEISLKGIEISRETLDKLTIFFGSYRIDTEGLKVEKDIELSTIKAIYESFNEDAIYISLSQNEKTKIAKLVDFIALYDSAMFRLELRNNKISDSTFIIGQYSNLKKARENIFNLEKQIVSLKDSIQKQFKFIKNLYTKSGNSSFVKQSSGTGQTDLDGTRLGTVFGIGLVSLENNFFQSPTWFLYVGVKIRWDDFDNRFQKKEKRYKSWRSRCAVVVAMSYTNNIYYNGQKLNDTYLGFKPVIGLSFEPVKHLDIGTGIISFIPESAGIEKTEIRPYVSLSFDFNLFNYLIQKK